MTTSSEYSDSEMEFGGIFAFRIEATAPSYSMNVERKKGAGEAYREYFHLNLTGEMLIPEKFKGRTGNIFLIGDRSMLYRPKPKEGEDWSPSVGSIEIRGERTEYLGSLPPDMMWGLVSSIHAGLVNVIVMTGQQLRYGRARIYGVHFENEIDPEDY